MMHDFAIGLMAAGATLVVSIGGLLARDALARRRPSDVFNYIEPPRREAPMRCTCSPHRATCVCAVDGVRNPRGAGRGRAQPMGPTLDEVQRARVVGCPGRCRHISQCSTPAVCRAVMRANFQHRNDGGSLHA